MTLTLPISIQAYGQDRLVLQNRRQRRSKVLRPDFTSGNWSDQAANHTSIAHATSTPSTMPLLSDPVTVKKTPEGITERSADEVRLADSSLTQAVLLDWLGQQPIAFHRIYVDIGGSVAAAVWLSMVLSTMASAPSEQINASGVYAFTLSKTQCEADTGLTESEQINSHRQLVKTGVLSVNYPRAIEKHSGSAPSPSFKLDLSKLTALLLARSEGLAEMVRHSAALRPSADVQALEHRARVRAARRHA